MPENLQQWLDSAEEGYRPADLAFLALEESYVFRDPSGDRITVRYFQSNEDQSLQGKVIFGSGAQGPPDHAHGGAMAALLDDAMGGACWLSGYPVLAVNLNITFRQMLPLHTPCLVETKVTMIEGRKISAHGRLFSRDTGQVYSEGEALFVVLDIGQIDTMSPKAKAILQKMADHRRG